MYQLSKVKNKLNDDDVLDRKELYKKILDARGVTLITGPFGSGKKFCVTTALKESDNVFITKAAVNQPVACLRKSFNEQQCRKLFEQWMQNDFSFIPFFTPSCVPTLVIQDACALPTKDWNWLQEKSREPNPRFSIILICSNTGNILYSVKQDNFATWFKQLPTIHMHNLDDTQWIQFQRSLPPDQFRSVSSYLLSNPEVQLGRCMSYWKMTEADIKERKDRINSLFTERRQGLMTTDKNDPRTIAFRSLIQRAVGGSDLVTFEFSGGITPPDLETEEAKKTLLVGSIFATYDHVISFFCPLMYTVAREWLVSIKD
ncbi:hypothetical protein RCL1_000135 [Eukaryota sp. TZLM3-RCL]